MNVTMSGQTFNVLYDSHQTINGGLKLTYSFARDTLPSTCKMQLEVLGGSENFIHFLVKIQKFSQYFQLTCRYSLLVKVPAIG